MHESNIERNGQYLLYTWDNALVMKPLKDDGGNIQFDLDCYVDTDFAEILSHKDKQDSICIKSMTEYISSVANCLIVWKILL